MQNAIIPLIPAIIFLGIGLFIRKSNKQIEIQTIVKTNIIEKPAIEYVLGFNYLNKGKSAKFLRLN